MSRNDRARKQARWEKEKARIDLFRRQAPDMKAALRAKGCNLPFYDGLDSAEDEFRKLVAWAKSEFRSLHDVFEVPIEDFDDEKSWERLGLPVGLSQIYFTCSEEMAQSYTTRDSNANIRGCAIAFHDENRALHSIIQIVKNPVCKFEHKDNKYLLKLPYLLHEIGHVKDYEEKNHFNPDAGEADVIEGEVFAHLFSLSQSYGRGYHMGGNSYFDTLKDYGTSTDYRGEVARRVLERFKKPNIKAWGDYDI